MTVALSKRALISNQASIEDCLRACGAQLWPQAALQQYQRKQERKVRSAHIAKFRADIVSPIALCNTLVVAAIAAWVAFYVGVPPGGEFFAFYLLGKVLYHWGEWPAWQSNNLLEEDVYWHNGVKRCLPEPVQNVVEDVRALFPDAGFAVSFLGQDPVLHVLVNGRSYNALVWDVDADGAIEIKPPRFN